MTIELYFGYPQVINKRPILYICLCDILKKPSKQIVCSVFPACCITLGAFKPVQVKNTLFVFFSHTIGLVRLGGQSTKTSKKSSYENR